MKLRDVLNVSVFLHSYFNPRKSKLTVRKETPSLGQLLGLCEDNFSKAKDDLTAVNDGFGVTNHIRINDDENKDNSQDLLDLCSGKFTESVARDSRPPKPVSILSKLLDQEETQGTESQVD